jgi:hypothetical protein
MGRYRYIQDPGHGWLEVSLHELSELGLVNKISTCSYVSSDYQSVYLEEDIDMGFFIEAKVGPYKGNEQAWKDWMAEQVASVYQENTFVRQLNYYSLRAA